MKKIAALGAATFLAVMSLSACSSDTVVEEDRVPVEVIQSETVTGEEDGQSGTEGEVTVEDVEEESSTETAR